MINKYDIIEELLKLNKYDIIQELLKQQYETPQVYKEMENYIRELFKPVEKALQEACKQNNIEGFEVEFISAYQDNNTRRLLSNIIKRFIDFGR